VKACSEAELYRRCGLQGVIVENMHDVPYMRGVAGPEVTACMSRIAGEVRKVIGDEMMLGVQVLSCEFHGEVVWVWLFYSKKFYFEQYVFCFVFHITVGSQSSKRVEKGVCISEMFI